jgi:hypothetical protein
MRRARSGGADAAPTVMFERGPHGARVLEEAP